ncbi:DUF2383 domain-containing protein [Pseudotabrizicola sp. 4114]|uniref:DUF2383 domain-containing protein n=1 Tax=Pseudotabrizicola sp. 4114 TaxID=2817731 RepID=UPI0028592BE5|nr:chemotaxis regulatin CheY-phosphate phosphatase CheZ [Pseudorhodobacter sp. 4114]
MLTPTTAAMMLDTETGESPEAAPDAADALLALQRRTADALAGYVTMVDKAEPAFRPVAERYRAIHDRHNAALTAMLIRQGVEPDADGSFMGTVNKAVVSLRALFDDIDSDVMDSIRNGENYVLEAFDDAIGSAGMPPADVTLLRDMRDELVVLLQDTRHLD